jgi:hypothetical protein
VPRGPLRLATLLALLSLAAGCGGGASGPSPDEIVAKTVAETGKQKTFHLLVDVENVTAPRTGLGLTFVDGDVEVPDRMHAKVGGTFAGIAVNTELIVIGTDYWLKTPFIGGWRSIDVSTSPLAFFDPETGLLPVIRDATDLSSNGTEEVGGVECDRVEGKVPAEKLAPLISAEPSDAMLPIELWIGKDDSLLRRLRVSGPVSPGEAEDAVRTIELSKFGEPVDISPPG